MSVKDTKSNLARVRLYALIRTNGSVTIGNVTT